MSRQQLYLITGPTPGRELAAAVAAALRGGVQWVQLRDKSMAARALLDQAIVLRRLCHDGGAGFIVNDRIDVALAAGADGVHLGEAGLPPTVARRLLPEGMLLGVSVHSYPGAQAAASAGADYITFGNIYPTPSHPGRPGTGAAALAEVVAAIDIPVLAVGGVAVDNISPLLATGCAGVAVISAILHSPAPEVAATALRQALDAYPQPPPRSMPTPPDGATATDP